MSNLFASGVRPVVDDYLLKQAAEKRDYGDYWSASSAGYCMRKNIFERLQIPYTTEDARKQRVFSVGHIFHSWLQDITKKAGLSIAQELELQDEELMLRGHIDDLVLIKEPMPDTMGAEGEYDFHHDIDPEDFQRLILYDYKTAHSRSFTYSKGRPMSHYHKLQLGTYMYMLRRGSYGIPPNEYTTGYNEGQMIGKPNFFAYPQLTEGRILTMDKDALRMDEKQLLWSEELSSEVRDYWTALNKAWDDYQRFGRLPPCGCADHENGFMAREQWNPFFKHGEPCSEQYFKEWLAKEEVGA